MNVKEKKKKDFSSYRKETSRSGKVKKKRKCHSKKNWAKFFFCFPISQGENRIYHVVYADAASKERG